MNGLADTLQGCRIVEFGLNLPGPMLTRRLGRYGANTRKIEPPTGDPTARMFRGSDGVPVLYRMLNADKDVERLDLKSAEGRQRVLRYIAESDILVESSTPGVMDALGVGYETCRQINPALVYCSITGHGDAPLPGHDINFLAAAGYGPAMGYGERDGLIGFPMGDIAGGVLAAESAILAALLRRHAAREGLRIQIDITAELRRLNVMGAAWRAAPRRRGDDFLKGIYPCYRVYRCKDGSLLAVGALEEKFWKRFCALIRCASLQHRQFERVDEGDAHLMVEQALLAHSAAQWEAASLASPCCLTAVLQD